MFRNDPWMALWIPLMVAGIVGSVRMGVIRSKSYNPLSNRGWQARLRRNLGIPEGTWERLEYSDRRLLRRVHRACRKRRVKIMVTTEKGMKFMSGGGFMTVAHFDSDDVLERPELYLALGGPTHLWNKALLREASRMDQWWESCPQWKGRRHQGGDCREMLEQWVSGGRELSNPDLDEVIGKCIALDLDCHRRTVRKMIAEGDHLAFDVHDYVRMANAEIWGYYVIKLRRSWWRVQPSGDFDLWSAMPGTFMREMDYMSMPMKTINLYENVCYGVRDWRETEKEDAA